MTALGLEELTCAGQARRSVRRQRVIHHVGITQLVQLVEVFSPQQRVEPFENLPIVLRTHNHSLLGRHRDGPLLPRPTEPLVPAVGRPLGRFAPASLRRLSGRFFPGGTKVQRAGPDGDCHDFRGARARSQGGRLVWWKRSRGTARSVGHATSAGTPMGLAVAVSPAGGAFRLRPGGVRRRI